MPSDFVFRLSTSVAVGAREMPRLAVTPMSPFLTSSSASISTASSLYRRHQASSFTPINCRLLNSKIYESNATMYWDKFYERHQNKFFKDRHYLEKDWGHYFSLDTSSAKEKVVCEVGCGAGNTVFPLLTAYPDLFIHACDSSPKAISLVKSNTDFQEDRVNAFVCDVTSEDICQKIAPSSVDVVTLIFSLSAVSPVKMPLILENIKRLIKPNGYVLVRDYAVGDFAQLKLQEKNRTIEDNFYVRGDGTCAFFFSEEFLLALFRGMGFKVVDIDVYCRQIENRFHDITMNRRWIRAVFSISDYDTSYCASNTEATPSFLVI